MPSLGRPGVLDQDLAPRVGLQQEQVPGPLQELLLVLPPRLQLRLVGGVLGDVHVLEGAPDGAREGDDEELRLRVVDVLEELLPVVLGVQIPARHQIDRLADRLALARELDGDLGEAGEDLQRRHLAGLLALEPVRQEDLGDRLRDLVVVLVQALRPVEQLAPKTASSHPLLTQGARGLRVYGTAAASMSDELACQYAVSRRPRTAVLSCSDSEPPNRSRDSAAIAMSRGVAMTRR